MSTPSSDIHCRLCIAIGELQINSNTLIIVLYLYLLQRVIGKIRNTIIKTGNFHFEKPTIFHYQSRYLGKFSI